ncbi:MAG: aminotransferase class IV [Terrimesophilobacter sp.]
MSTAVVYRWSGDGLVELDYRDSPKEKVDVADSLLVTDGMAFALGMHRERFTAAAHTFGQHLDGYSDAVVNRVWDAAFRMIPPTGDWFPRVELRSLHGAAHFGYRHRTAPKLDRTVRLISHSGPDPRRVPSIKGPDLDVLLSARVRAKAQGADDVALLTSDGYVIDAGTSALVWWRGGILCAPPEGKDDAKFARVDSVTAKSLFGLAAALGVETHRERVTPAELDGTEVWALNALHGIRIVTGWAHGPELAELPGRIGVWRERRHVLRQPIGEQTQ